MKLAMPHWPGTECDAWDMVALASHFIEAEGWYRLPTQSGHGYLLLRHVERRG